MSFTFRRDLSLSLFCLIRISFLSNTPSRIPHSILETHTRTRWWRGRVKIWVASPRSLSSRHSRSQPHLYKRTRVSYPDNPPIPMRLPRAYPRKTDQLRSYQLKYRPTGQYEDTPGATVESFEHIANTKCIPIDFNTRTYLQYRNCTYEIKKLSFPNPLNDPSFSLWFLAQIL